MTVVLVGADPEFFVKENGKHISAYGLIEGTKANPQPVNKGAVQVDGMALEFNIQPAETAEEFSSNLDTVIGQMKNIVLDPHPTYEFDFSPVAYFSKEYMDEQPEDAKKLGCDPDFNAYTGEPNNPPDGGALFRTASGHIHIGWTDNMDISDPEHIEACRMMVKQLDCVLGLSSVLWDKDTKRRELYGKAGAYRPKPYGVEYRVMSNAWVMDVDARDFIFNAVQWAFNDLVDGMDYTKNHSRGVSKYINESKVSWCWENGRRYAVAIGMGDWFDQKYFNANPTAAPQMKTYAYGNIELAGLNFAKQAPWPPAPAAQIILDDPHANNIIVDDFDENWLEEAFPNLEQPEI